jgi:hypothetical protein
MAWCGIRRSRLSTTPREPNRSVDYWRANMEPKALGAIIFMTSMASVMSFTVKVVLARVPGTREIDRDGPMELLTRTSLLGLVDPHPAILRQIEGAGEAFFDAEWEDDKLEIGKRVEDKSW